LGDEEEDAQRLPCLSFGWKTQPAISDKSFCLEQSKKRSYNHAFLSMENNILLSSFETSVLLCAICTIILVGTATCRRLRGEQTSLGKRPREDEILDLPQKRIWKRGSHHPPVNPEAPQIEGVPEAPQLEAGTPVASPVQVEEVKQEGHQKCRDIIGIQDESR